MDHRSFDSLTRSLASAKTRRGILGSLAAIGAGLVGARTADAHQVTQAQCGNKTCKNNPAVCADGCVCCVYSNGNSRCHPPGTCSPGTVVCAGGCDDGNPCTIDTCDPVLGCQHAPNTDAPCTAAGGALGICDASGTCQPEAVTCIAGGAGTCENRVRCNVGEGSETCYCFPTFDGEGAFCTVFSASCDLVQCPNGQSDCTAPGTVCTVESCCDYPVCDYPCPTG